MSKDRSSPAVPRYLSEGVNEECKKLLVSLPVEKGWNGNNLYQYQGFWHYAIHLQGVLKCQKHFEARDTDIILVTTPKCGTTWLKALTFAITNRKQHPDFFQGHPLLTTSPHLLVPFLELRVFFHDGSTPDLTKLPPPRLFATHLPTVSLPESVRRSSCKMVYLSRNPKDTFVSLWHFMNRLRPKELGDISVEEGFDKFCRGVNSYGPYWDHVLGYWKESLENPERFLFLSYEEMTEQPVKHIKKLAQFFDHPFSEEEENGGVIDSILKLCSFDTLSNLEVTKTKVLSSGIKCDAFYRKGEVGDWKNYLTEEMEKRIDRITEEKFRDSGLKL